MPSARTSVGLSPRSTPLHSSVQHFAPDELTPAMTDHLWKLYTDVTHDFVPPLGQRDGTTAPLTPGPAPNSVAAYFQDMLGQHNLVSTDADGQPAGFLSYRPAHPVPAPVVAAGIVTVEQCVYVSTVAVRRELRGKGHGRAMYAALLERQRADDDFAWVLLRTWSTNGASMHLLAGLGFTHLARTPDERGPGIDTIYLGRRV